jgi:hypothetical protein
MSEWYVINDMEEFIDTTRVLVFNNFGTENSKTDIFYSDLSLEEQQEIDNILSHHECSVIAKSMARKQINKRNNKTRYMISDEIFLDIVNSFNERMVSNILQGLVNKGMIETAFDTESNDFVFYVPESLKKHEKPETD